MTAHELLAKLAFMNPDARVMFVFDGISRGSVDKVWYSRKGEIVVADESDVVYETEDRPESAPTQEQKRYWYAEDHNDD